MTDPKDILRTYWGFEHFKELQLEIIDSVLKVKTPLHCCLREEESQFVFKFRD